MLIISDKIYRSKKSVDTETTALEDSFIPKQFNS